MQFSNVLVCKIIIAYALERNNTQSLPILYEKILIWIILEASMCVDEIGCVKTITCHCINKLILVLKSFPLSW